MEFELSNGVAVVGDKVAPLNNKPGESWEEGIIEGEFMMGSVSVHVTKSKDKVVWSCKELCNLKKL